MLFSFLAFCWRRDLASAVRSVLTDATGQVDSKISSVTRVVLWLRKTNDLAQECGAGEQDVCSGFKGHGCYFYAAINADSSLSWKCRLTQQLNNLWHYDRCDNIIHSAQKHLPGSQVLTPLNEEQSRMWGLFQNPHSSYCPLLRGFKISNGVGKV